MDLNERRRKALELLTTRQQEALAEARAELDMAEAELDVIANTADRYCQRALALEARQEYLIQELAKAVSDLEFEQTETCEHCVLPGEIGHRHSIAEELDEKFGKL